jgi:hypothetical protein
LLLSPPASYAVATPPWDTLPARGADRTSELRRGLAGTLKVRGVHTPCCSLRRGLDFPSTELDRAQHPADARSLVAANASSGSTQHRRPAVQGGWERMYGGEAAGRGPPSGCPCSGAAGEIGREVEEDPDIWVPHVSEMREMKRES